MGERAPEAGSRWRKPRAREQRTRLGRGFGVSPTNRRRLLLIPRAGAQASACSGEGALGDGRRPGPAKAHVFDETAAEPGRRPEATGMRQRCWIRRGAQQRTSEATSSARHAVENTATGRCSAEEPSIGAPPGPRFTPHASVRSPGSRHVVMVVANAEAGGSPSSEAPPGRLLRRAEGNRTIRRVLVTGVGCRSRRDASFSWHDGAVARRFSIPRGSSRRPACL